MDFCLRWQGLLRVVVEFADHNCIHASDVLHGVFYMTTQKIPGFFPLLDQSNASNDSESDSDSGITSGSRPGGDSNQKSSSGDYGTLMDAIPLLELLALYTAAAMHDYDHPGRTNAFLVATLSQQVSLTVVHNLFIIQLERSLLLRIERFT